jgi:hypothetical protein
VQHPQKETVTIRTEPVPELKRLAVGFPQRRPGFEPRSGHVGFVVEEAALDQVFSEYFGFPCQFSFHRLRHTRNLLSGTGQLVAKKKTYPNWDFFPYFLSPYRKM